MQTLKWLATGSEFCNSDSIVKSKTIASKFENCNFYKLEQKIMPRYLKTTGCGQQKYTLQVVTKQNLKV